MQVLVQFWVLVPFMLSHSDGFASYHSIYIAGVHDSYWTHACDVDQMNRILCEKFVELYERPILEEVMFITLC